MFIQLTKDYLGQKAGCRLDVDEAAAQSLIQQDIAEAIPGDPLAPVVARSMETMLATLTTSLNSAVESALKEFAAAQTRSQRHKVPAIFGPGGNGDPQRTFGQFLLAVRMNDRKALEEMGSHWADWDNVGQKTALNTQAGAQGGYTVPTQFLPEVLTLANEQSIVRSRATRIPMATQSVEIPVLDVTTAPTAGETAFFGGLQANWTEEAATIGEEEPTFKQLRLQAHELSGYTLASNTLLADNAVGLEQLLRQLFAGAIAWHEDYAFLRGNGVGRPLGVLNAAALISVTRSGASAFALADAAGMLGRLLPGGDERTIVWAMHPTVLTKLLQMTGGDNLVFLGNDVTGKPRMTLFGYPVERTEKLPSLNTLGDVLLLDLRYYLVGERQMVEVAASEHYAFRNNQVAWRFVTRCDGQPWLRSAVTLADASSTLSPFVGLAAG